ncbi:hypothetical protein [Kitasatospora terrestris]|uniref:hypothetical protein n=1 Tax=Kitasatospora terrestris TaxID=258051 RepID=UPI0031EAE119
MSWVAGVVLAAAAVTFQDTLVDTAKTVLSLDSLPDRISPQNAIQVVEVRNVRDLGEFLSRHDPDGQLAASFRTGAVQRSADVVDVGRSEWMITLRGRASQQVRITDIVPEFEAEGCTAPLPGSLIVAHPQGGEDVITLDTVIDSPAPKLTVSAPGADGKPAQPFFTGAEAKVITLDRNESVAFLITATASRSYCQWRYRVHYQVNGGTAETVISRPGGKPFELTARLPDVSGYQYVHLSPVNCDSQGWRTVTGAGYAGINTPGGLKCPIKPVLYGEPS